MNKISAYVVTKNEENRLNKTLHALQQVADEIVVVDSGSTDKTEEIAKNYGAKFIFNQWKSYCDQKYFAEQQCSNDWVLLVDADEVLSDKLIAEINELKNNFEYQAYKMKIRNILPHQNKPYSPIADFNVVRLYNKNFCSMPKDKGNLDRIEVPKNIKIGQLKAYAKHFSFLNIEQTVHKYNVHSGEMQKLLEAKGKKYSAGRIVIEFPRQFCHYYFKKALIFGGIEGFIYANCMAFFRFLKIAKNWEKQKDKK